MRHRRAGACRRWHRRSHLCRLVANASRSATECRLASADFLHDVVKAGQRRLVVRGLHIAPAPVQRLDHRGQHQPLDRGARRSCGSSARSSKVPKRAGSTSVQSAFAPSISRVITARGSTIAPTAGGLNSLPLKRGSADSGGTLALAHRLPQLANQEHKMVRRFLKLRYGAEKASLGISTTSSANIENRQRMKKLATVSAAWRVCHHLFQATWPPRPETRRFARDACGVPGRIERERVNEQPPQAFANVFVQKVGDGDTVAAPRRQAGRGHSFRLGHERTARHRRTSARRRF